MPACRSGLLGPDWVSVASWGGGWLYGLVRTTLIQCVAQVTSLPTSQISRTYSCRWSPCLCQPYSVCCIRLTTQLYGFTVYGHDDRRVNVHTPLALPLETTQDSLQRVRLNRPVIS